MDTSIHYVWILDLFLALGYNGFMGKIEFVSTVKHLEKIEDCIPRPAKYFIPEWFKDIPSNNNMTVKQCPSFPDYFSQGYIVPMWTDIRIFFDSTSKEGGWQSSSKDFVLEDHGNPQFIDHVEPYFHDVSGKYVFKAICPWKIITPPGWSVLQLPLFYHFNKDWSILPGVIDTDIYHNIHQQILYHKNGEIVEIKRGQPFVLYIPFNRSDKLDLDIRSATEEDAEYFNFIQLNLSSKFPPNRVYREMQRNREKKCPMM